MIIAIIPPPSSPCAIEVSILSCLFLHAYPIHPPTLDRFLLSVFHPRSSSLHLLFLSLIIPLSNSSHFSLAYLLYSLILVYFLLHSSALASLLLWLDAGFLTLLTYLFRNSWIGLVLYLVLGLLVTLSLLLSFLLSLLLSLLLSSLAKFGYYSFILVTLSIFLCSSMNLLLLDHLLKFGYLLLLLHYLLLLRLELDPYYPLHLLLLLTLLFLLHLLQLLNSTKYLLFAGSMIGYSYILVSLV